MHVGPIVVDRRPGVPLRVVVDVMRAELAALEAEGLTPADFTGESARPSPMAAQLFEELVRRLEEDFARAPDPPRSER